MEIVLKVFNYMILAIMEMASVDRNKYTRDQALKISVGERLGTKHINQHSLYRKREL